ncbi:retrotransposon hot spot (RHS) protein [Trypanosoma conorhini]|uniref:Retrotransposon hot spot (RHS) protein n=1 Tax=Trypanosoma conorhini TaxID=83891 RepID=A0A422PCQ1_9TRYP|nr:retrotransposon hot spot (RHS) protein [Trypanosoma conorhini]RNF15502.1 retrotransposon hot spot (RHS) protein [Trypanosoma conorhini]
MAGGAYLLYQLQHYDAEQLPTVAYFVGGSAFLFDKARKTMSRFPFFELGDGEFSGGRDAHEGVYHLRRDMGREAGVVRQTPSRRLGRARRAAPRRNSLQGVGG